MFFGAPKSGPQNPPQRQTPITTFWRSQLITTALGSTRAGRQMCTLKIPLRLGFLYPVTVSTKTFVKWSCLHPPPSLSLHYWYLFLVVVGLLFFSLVFHLEHSAVFLATVLESSGCRQGVPDFCHGKLGSERSSPRLTNSCLLCLSTLNKSRGINPCWSVCFCVVFSKTPNIRVLYSSLVEIIPTHLCICTYIQIYFQWYDMEDLCQQLILKQSGTLWYWWNRT